MREGGAPKVANNVYIGLLAFASDQLMKQPWLLSMAPVLLAMAQAEAGRLSRETSHRD
jgi:hypothetical protein